ncbi:hypothetical protein B9Z55_009170 [Caenorhabditis nigoni]|nr:hypothetical protein B9Z55_009170 [Caenorhabditis nigoni]
MYQKLLFEEFYDRWKTNNMVTMEVYLGTEGFMMMRECHDESKNIYFQLNVFGKTINFRLSDQSKLPVAYFYPSDKETAVESIHNYFLDFFGDTVEYIWRAKHPDNFIPRLPNLSLSIDIWTDPSEITDIKSLEKFFDSSPVLKHLLIKLDTHEAISPESKFYQAESLRIIHQRPRTVRALLRHFKGRQATLHYCRCVISELIEFMNRWRSGEAFHKLEYLHIKILNGWQLNNVLNANGVKHIDATKKPPTHTVPKVCTSVRDNEPNTDPITSHTYVVRETDNRVASVSIQDLSFSFGVWKKTEEEFLRMVEAPN